jgi:hypothetical protein
MSPLIAQAERKRGQIAPKDEAQSANIDKLPELLQAYQKRSSLITNGTSHGFALSFAFLSAASHRWRVHSSEAMVSTTLNLPCVGQSKPVASPVRGSSSAGDLQIGQRRGLGNGLLHLRRKYLGTTTFWKNSRASITASAKLVATSPGATL